MRVQGRAAEVVDSPFGRLHPFQIDLIEALRDPEVGMIKVEAPVGVGKTTAIRKALQYCNAPVIATFPTTILVNAQSASISRGESVYHWPYDTKPHDRKYDLFVAEYTSRSLFDLAMRNYGEVSKLARGEILSRIFCLAPFIGGKNIVLTTPDVLWLIYSKKYKNFARLQEALAGSIVFFDEFHCYADLSNFYRLLNKLGEGRVSKVVLMSATPYMREDIMLDFKGSIVDISFQETDMQEVEGRVFNHPLRVEIAEFEYRNAYKLLERLRTALPDMARPTAVIFDSIFRLMQVESVLRNEFQHLRFLRYDGMVKDAIDLDENSVVLGTSSIEVGISMDFSSLVFEGSSWTAAIQRLGRVGRLRPGQALLLSDRSFKPYRPERDEIPRVEFERILREYLPDPCQDWTSGELFRGDTPSFLLVDPRGDCYIYGPGIFSMYEVEDKDDIPRDADDLVRLLHEFGVRDEDIPAVMMRVALFPVAGIVRAHRFRDRYVPVVSVKSAEDEWVVKLADKEYFYFKREVLDD
ncbi:MAG: type I-D CRISPR-associated helicase Cas3' [Actinobacteria bacterium]|nr:type I-D CRISPR-associated helicase Cas3' [Actinomycetota bacterium]